MSLTRFFAISTALLLAGPLLLTTVFGLSEYFSSSTLMVLGRVEYSAFICANAYFICFRNTPAARGRSVYGVVLLALVAILFIVGLLSNKADFIYVVVYFALLAAAVKLDADAQYRAKRGS